MARTIHSIPESASVFNVLTCTCPPDGDDDPNCKALIAFNEMTRGPMPNKTAVTILRP